MARLVEMIADKPVPFEEAVSQAALYVPPGRAMRRYEKFRTLIGPDTVSVDDKVRSGSSWLVMESLRSLAKRGTIKIYTNGHQDYIVLTDHGYRGAFGKERDDSLTLPSSFTPSNRYRIPTDEERKTSNDRQRELRAAKKEQS